MKKPKLLKCVRPFLMMAGYVLISLAIFAGDAFATAALVQEQDPQYKVTRRPSEELFLKKTASKDMLVTNLMAGYIHGIESNPLLDTSKKVDNYEEELVDMAFKYPVCDFSFGKLTSKFGFTTTNINYYRVTDINILDNDMGFSFEQELYDVFTLIGGYALEIMWYPNDENGTYIGNMLITGLKHKISDKLSQKLTYKSLYKNYLNRKAHLGNMNLGSNLRHDVRNIFEHELSAYITDITKLKVVNQFYINNSNDQYMDFYDYFAYKIGGTVTQMITKKFYGITTMYYQRKNYDSRTCTDKNKHQKDNLWVVSASLLYDVTKSASLYFNYAHTENHTNEPLERYSDNLYTFGLYYSF